MRQEINKIFACEAEAIMNIPKDNDYIKVIDIIHQCVHIRHGKLITSGMGKAGQIANNIATTFCSTGTPAVFLHPGEAQHGDMGLLQENDVLLVISNSGKTREVVELIALKNRLYPQIPVIAISGCSESPLVQAADCFLDTGNPAEVCPLGLTPTISTTIFTVLGDALVVMMMEKIGFTATDYAKRHHGGYLGDMARQMSIDCKK